MHTLSTERLVLRPFEQSDAKLAQQLAGDYDIARTTLHVPHPYPDGAAEAWIDAINKAAASGRMYAFAVTRRTDGALVGAMSIGLQAEHHRAELAYWTGRPFWGEGYTTEAAKKVLEFAFNNLQLNRVYAYAMTKNPASTRVMEKIGMSYEGTQRQHISKWGEFEDLAAYGILRSDYLTLTEK